MAQSHFLVQKLPIFKQVNIFIFSPLLLFGFILMYKSKPTLSLAPESVNFWPILNLNLFQGLLFISDSKTLLADFQLGFYHHLYDFLGKPIFSLFSAFLL
jgi:hypothetical protein